MVKEPLSLYDQCLLAYVRTLNHNVASLDRIVELRLLPTSVLATVYDKMCQFDSLKDILFVQLSNLELFNKLIKQTALKRIIFKCVQTLMAARRPIVSELRTRFCRATSVYYLQHESALLVKNSCLEHYQPLGEKVTTCCTTRDATSSQETCCFVGAFLDQISKGIRLGSFLSESGWLEESLHVFNITLSMIQLLDTSYMRYLIELNCLQKLLCAQTVFCCFKEANITCAQALNIIDKLTQQHQQVLRQRDSSASNSSSSSSSSRTSPNSDITGSKFHLRDSDNDLFSNIPNSLLANMYQQISVLHFYRSDYDLSYRWSVRALRYINEHTPHKIVVDVLRQLAKSCVVKRQFQLAGMLIKQAVRVARASFGINHQKYADALLDYGFFLLNVDSIANSVAVYTEAHEILCRIFGSRNLHVAVAHEDLAYCLYVLEYSSGKFYSASLNVDRAIDIMKELVPSNHLMLASAKRVKALILEEIALDTVAATLDYSRSKMLLEQSEELHRSALHLSLEAFGENNVQTSKHYGNLGRLYQSMSKFEEAEQMHKRAIRIKTQILGPYDYEVGLSIGHLASLYNYHMQKHQEAEELYMKSIEISLRLFGQSYSGLEYDYRGLIHVYETIGDQTRMDQYSNILEEWRLLRVENQAVRNNFHVDHAEDNSIEEITEKFFEAYARSQLFAADAALADDTADSNSRPVDAEAGSREDTEGEGAVGVSNNSISCREETLVTPSPSPTVSFSEEPLRNT